jgi:hypothetical protein
LLADIPTSIARYQKAISDTHKRLDFVIASGLYTIGSNMIFKIGTIENYNNNIIIASENMKPGKNNINIKIFSSQALMEGPSIKSNKLKMNNPIEIESKTKFDSKTTFDS